jgi:hypothetical protein
MIYLKSNRYGNGNFDPKRHFEVNIFFGYEILLVVYELNLANLGSLIEFIFN